MPVLRITTRRDPCNTPQNLGAPLSWIRSRTGGEHDGAEATAIVGGFQGESGPAGRRRLSRVAKACLDFGQRVQNSVFECRVDPTQWARLRFRLLDLYDPEEDSLRFYYLGANAERKIEHHGTKPDIDLDGPLIA